MFRIKTLAEIGEQRDKIAEYLDRCGRHESASKVEELYFSIYGRILATLGVSKIDDETLEWVCEEPLIVGTDY